MKTMFKLIFVSLLLPLLAIAQDEISLSTGIIGNGRLLGAKTYDGQATVGILGIDSNGNTVVKSISGKTVLFGSGTLESASDVILKTDSDAQRLLTFGASSDTALTLKFGDGGTTATQQIFIGASTADADDDSTLVIGGGGAAGSTRGATITLPGEEVAGGGDLTFDTGVGDHIIFNIAGSEQFRVKAGEIEFITGQSANIDAQTSPLNFQIGGTNTAAIVTAGITTIGTFTSSKTSDLGWSVVAGANTACNTTCTSACVVGQDSGSSNIFVGCTDATADVCLCAGAS